MDKGLVIGVGFQKTGTSSLREVLKILGFKVKDACPRALIPILKNDREKIRKIIGDHTALEDTPWYMIYKELDEMYPNSKFILTVRDSESWYRSVSNHIGDLRSAHHEWIYGRGKGLPKYHKENTIKVYEEHIKNVKAYFQHRPNDLLIVDITKNDGWEEICDFLNMEVPSLKFPHINNRLKVKKEDSKIVLKAKFIKKQFSRYIKIKYIDMMGYW